VNIFPEYVDYRARDIKAKIKGKKFKIRIQFSKWQKIDLETKKKI
jgi:hypothetical protein